MHALLFLSLETDAHTGLTLEHTHTHTMVVGKENTAGHNFKLDMWFVRIKTDYFIICLCFSQISRVMIKEVICSVRQWDTHTHTLPKPCSPEKPTCFKVSQLSQLCIYVKWQPHNMYQPILSLRRMNIVPTCERYVFFILYMVDRWYEHYPHP